jgi:S1-C subfamily serine protease
MSQQPLNSNCSAFRWLALAIAFCIAVYCQCTRADTQSISPELAQLRLGDGAQVINGRDGVPRQGERFDRAWKPASGKSRDITTEAVYEKVAPSVVIVKLPNGHGSGFVVDAGGWIITNNHVAVEAVPDPDTGAQMVDIYFGRMEDGWMNIIDQPVKAFVYKVSPQKDLALLKLVAPAPAGVTVAALPLAARNPKPGSDCVAIGHPASASLWSVRSGQITGMGIFPDEMTDYIITSLSLKGDQAQRMRSFLDHAPKCQVLYSNTGINSGDSGGPLVNADGEVIGVTFAMPTFQDDQRQGTTSYHVALEELRDFLKDRPTDPVMMTDPWPDCAVAELRDLSNSGQPDALIFAPAEKQPWDAILFDLLHESSPDLTVDQLSDPSQRSNWKFQFALQRGSIVRAFYDTQGSGKIDLILAGADLDGPADVAMRLVDGTWRAEPAAGRALVSPGNFMDPMLRRRLIAMLRRRPR